MPSFPLRLLFLMLLLALGLALLGRAAWADDAQWVKLEDLERPRSGSKMDVSIQAFPGDGRMGAFGFVVVRCENPDTKPRQITVRLVERQGEGRQTYVRTVTLAPSTATSSYLPLPSTGGWASLELSGPGWEGTRVSARTGSGHSMASILGVHPPTDTPRHSEWEALLKRAVIARGGTRRHGSAAQWCDARSLPADGRLLSAFDVVVVTASPADLEVGQHEALLHYVAGGGCLVLPGVGDLAGSPYARLATSLGAESRAAEKGWGAYGFGRWLAFASPDPDDPQADVERWLGVHAFPAGGAAYPTLASGIPMAFRARLAIPGLGDVPVQLFFFLILLFAVLVGPVSYLWLRRRRRLAWLVVTIPVAGFLASSVILLYGFLSEGFGVRGAIRSFAVLDQRTHEAAIASGRTLYAGLSPSVLVPGSGTLVTPPFDSFEGHSKAWFVDVGAGGRIDGAALPSRTPTPFSTLSVGRARERLRFQRQADGTFEVLHGPDFRPVVGDGALILRTPSGAWFRSDASGRLRPAPGLDEGELEHAVKRLVAPAALLALGEENNVEHGFGFRSYRSSSRLDFTSGGLWGFSSYFEANWTPRLVPGSYLARVTSLPSLDSLGLDVDYEAVAHVVLGLLGDEDIVE